LKQHEKDLIGPEKYSTSTSKLFSLLFSTNPVWLKMFSIVVAMLFVHTTLQGSRCLALTNPIKSRHGAVQRKSIQSKLRLGASTSDENQEVVLNKYSR
jgi:hypothetical protein